MSEKNITVGAAIIVGPDRLHQLRKLLPQLAQLDQVVIINTSGQGAVNNYVRKFKNMECHDFQWRPTSRREDGTRRGHNEWGFAAARDESFRHLKTTHAFWIDTDDLIGRRVGDEYQALDPHVVAAAFRKLAADPRGIELWYLPYIYSTDDQGNPNVIHSRERFVALENGWHWIYPIHEVMVPTDGRPHRPAEARDLVIIHQASEEAAGSAERNYEMLVDWHDQLSEIEDKRSIRRDLARCRAQLGNTLYGLGRHAEAVEFIENQFLANHPEAPAIERYTAMTFAARSCIALGNYPAAKRLAGGLIAMEPTLPDGYLLLATAKAGNEEDAVEVLRLLEVAEGSQDHPPSYIKNPLDYTFEPLLLKGNAYLEIGEYEKALEAALLAQSIRPLDLKAEQLREKAALKVRQMNAAEAAHVIFRFLEEFGEHEKALRLFDYLPYVAQQVTEVRDAAVNAVTKAEHLVNAEKYQELHGGYEVPELMECRPEVLKYVQRRVGEHQKVLIHGDGAYAIEMAKAGRDVTYVEINKNAAQVAKTKADELGLSNLKIVEGWLEKLDPEEYGWVHHFDAVVSIDQIEMVPDISFYLGCLGDTARDGAPVIITTSDGAWDQGDVTPDQRKSRKPFIVRAFTQDTLEALLLSAKNWHLTECHDLPAEDSIREGQGWVVAEMRRQDRPMGPIVRIPCGSPFEEWSPDSLERGGIGGSETAVVHIAKHMQEQGCRVVVYGPKVGIYDSVLYRDQKDFSKAHHSDLLISWRNLGIFDTRPNAVVTVVWAHDLNYMPCPDSYVENIDKVLVLSEFHKGHWLKMHPNFREEQIFVTRNGIDPERFKAQVERKEHHYFYSSSWDRGLDELMEVWPAIKEAIPDAVLHVAYGVKTAEMMLRSYNDEAGLAKLYAKQQQLRQMDGVVVHGRMNQRELAEMQMGCEAWLYPYQPDMPDGGFMETYCITALEAQAAGALPICRMNGALEETVRFGIPWSAEAKTEDVVLVLRELTTESNPTLTEELQKNREWALSQTWSSLATEWINTFIND